MDNNHYGIGHLCYQDLAYMGGGLRLGQRFRSLVPLGCLINWLMAKTGGVERKVARKVLGSFPPTSSERRMSQTEGGVNLNFSLIVQMNGCVRLPGWWQ